MVTNPTTWQEKQAQRPDPIADALAVLLPDLGVMEHAVVQQWRQRFSDALDAYEEALDIYRQCDEPGCTRVGSCGFPVEGGYRRTCFEHSQYA